ncbi:hypothetical protein [Pseudomonas cremoricolorata]|uniref:hypothetical protein n=1 Tax=Pseudomonas cremoricolorata TaxID=157783 RepID=UPI0003F6CD3C|nr:hypothetical protein [Pseudomonas cremoricolorata]
MEKTSDTAQAEQGAMTASVEGQAFKAVDVHWDGTGGVLGQADNERFIYLGFPKDIKEGIYPIGQDGVRAYVGGAHSGDAVSGSLNVRSAGTAGGKMRGKFDFVAESDMGNEIRVEGGEFSVVIGPSMKSLSAGHLSAKLDKPLQGNSTIKASDVAYNGEPTAPTTVFATQTEGLQGGLQRLGVIFLINHDSQGQVSLRALMSIDYRALETFDLVVAQLDFKPSSHLLVDFTLKFSYNGDDYAIEDGSLKLQF